MPKKKLELTHLTRDGEARMVDVGKKEPSRRRATARARVRLAKDTFLALASGDTPKGDVLATARIAGILAAKRTSELIPLCHQVQLTKVELDLRLEGGAVIVEASAEASDRTGVEMEALVAASTAAMTIYDMLKAIEPGITFDVGVVQKSGGKTGTWKRSAP